MAYNVLGLFVNMCITLPLLGNDSLYQPDLGHQLLCPQVYLFVCAAPANPQSKNYLNTAAWCLALLCLLLLAGLKGLAFQCEFLTTHICFSMRLLRMFLCVYEDD